MRYRGEPFTGVNPHTAIVFLTFALFPWLTVIENVDVALKACGLDPGTRQAHATQLVQRVGIADIEAACPRELSDGMRQKMGFARALAVETEGQIDTVIDWGRYVDLFGYDKGSNELNVEP